MTNSVSNTAVEVTKNIHDTVIMDSWQPMSKHMTVKLSWQRQWQVMMLWFTSRCHKKVIFAFKILLSERHLLAVVINMH